MNQIKKWLCRSEIFGALLYNRLTKNSFFISQEELKILETKKMISVDKEEISFSEVQFIKNTILPNDTFSAPDGIYFEITKKCNLGCLHCFNNSGSQLNEEWSWNEISRLFNRFQEIGVLRIRFTGGEPLCSQYLLESLELAKNLGITTSIGTNGTLITKDVAQKLSLLSVNLIVVSIDGTEKIHDIIRGDGSFKKAIVGIRHLIDFEINTRINVVAMKGILDYVQELINIANQLKTDIVIRRMINTGRSDSSQMLSVKEYAELNKIIRNSRKNSKVNIFSHYDLHESKKSRIKVPFYSHQCSCGTRGLGILSNGDAFACGFLAPLGDSFRAGNVRDNDIMDIWLNSDVLKNQRRVSMTSFCRTKCSKKNVCVGSCPALLHISGQKDPYCTVMNN